jgi:hypothetical protein
MRRPRIGFATPASLVVLSAVVGLLLPACGGGGNSAVSDDGSKLRAEAHDNLKQAQITDKDFHAGNFSDGTRIDNRWFPLIPGTQYVLAGHANRGNGLLRHRVVFTVTDLSKEIDGVRSLVIWDRDYNAGRLVEGELAFHAQDDAGNVWNMGEYPEEYSGGKFDGAPDTWLAGVAGAKPGILMRAQPRLGTPTYLQGFAPKIDFSDAAKVYKVRQRNCVPVNCYSPVLVTEEWNPVERGAHQFKYYALGVGNIRVGAAGGKEDEELVLEKVARLGPAALAAVRAEAMKLDRRAYVARRDLYRHVPPARPLGKG